MTFYFHINLGWIYSLSLAWVWKTKFECESQDLAYL